MRYKSNKNRNYRQKYQNGNRNRYSNNAQKSSHDLSEWEEEMEYLEEVEEEDQSEQNLNDFSENPEGLEAGFEGAYEAVQNPQNQTVQSQNPGPQNSAGRNQSVQNLNSGNNSGNSGRNQNSSSMNTGNGSRSQNVQNANSGNNSGRAQNTNPNSSSNSGRSQNASSSNRNQNANNSGNTGQNQNNQGGNSGNTGRNQNVQNAGNASNTGHSNNTGQNQNYQAANSGNTGRNQNAQNAGNSNNSGQNQNNQGGNSGNTGRNQNAQNAGNSNNPGQNQSNQSGNNGNPGRNQNVQNSNSNTNNGNFSRNQNANTSGSTGSSNTAGRSQNFQNSSSNNRNQGSQSGNSSRNQNSQNSNSSSNPRNQNVQNSRNMKHAAGSSSSGQNQNVSGSGVTGLNQSFPNGNPGNPVNTGRNQSFENVQNSNISRSGNAGQNQSASNPSSSGRNQNIPNSGSTGQSQNTQTSRVNESTDYSGVQNSGSDSFNPSASGQKSQNQPAAGPTGGYSRSSRYSSSYFFEEPTLRDLENLERFVTRQNSLQVKLLRELEEVWIPKLRSATRISHEEYRDLRETTKDLQDNASYVSRTLPTRLLREHEQDINLHALQGRIQEWKKRAARNELLVTMIEHIECFESMQEEKAYEHLNQMKRQFVQYANLAYIPPNSTIPTAEIRKELLEQPDFERLIEQWDSIEQIYNLPDDKERFMRVLDLRDLLESDILFALSAGLITNPSKVSRETYDRGIDLIFERPREMVRLEQEASRKELEIIEMQQTGLESDQTDSRYSSDLDDAEGLKLNPESTTDPDARAGSTSGFVQTEKTSESGPAVQKEFLADDPEKELSGLDLDDLEELFQNQKEYFDAGFNLITGPETDLEDDSNLPGTNSEAGLDLSDNEPETVNKADSGDAGNIAAELTVLPENIQVNMPENMIDLIDFVDLADSAQEPLDLEDAGEQEEVDFMPDPDDLMDSEDLVSALESLERAMDMVAEAGEISVHKDEEPADEESEFLEPQAEKDFDGDKTASLKQDDQEEEFDEEFFPAENISEQSEKTEGQEAFEQMIAEVFSELQQENWAGQSGMAAGFGSRTDRYSEYQEKPEIELDQPGNSMEKPQTGLQARDAAAEESEAAEDNETDLALFNAEEELSGQDEQSAQTNLENTAEAVHLFEDFEKSEDWSDETENQLNSNELEGLNLEEAQLTQLAQLETALREEDSAGSATISEPESAVQHGEVLPEESENAEEAADAVEADETALLRDAFEDQKNENTEDLDREAAEAVRLFEEFEADEDFKKEPENTSGHDTAVSLPHYDDDDVDADNAAGRNPGMEGAGSAADAVEAGAADADDMNMDSSADSVENVENPSAEQSQQSESPADLSAYKELVAEFALKPVMDDSPYVYSRSESDQETSSRSHKYSSTLLQGMLFDKETLDPHIENLKEAGESETGMPELKPAGESETGLLELNSAGEMLEKPVLIPDVKAENQDDLLDFAASETSEQPEDSAVKSEPAVLDSSRHTDTAAEEQPYPDHPGSHVETGSETEAETESETVMEAEAETESGSEDEIGPEAGDELSMTYVTAGFFTTRQFRSHVLQTGANIDQLKAEAGRTRYFALDEGINKYMMPAITEWHTLYQLEIQQQMTGSAARTESLALSAGGPVSDRESDSETEIEILKDSSDFAVPADQSEEPFDGGESDQPADVPVRIDQSESLAEQSSRETGPVPESEEDARTLLEQTASRNAMQKPAESMLPMLSSKEQTSETAQTAPKETEIQSPAGEMETQSVAEETETQLAAGETETQSAAGKTEQNEAAMDEAVQSQSEPEAGSFEEQAGLKEEKQAEPVQSNPQSASGSGSAEVQADRKEEKSEQPVSTVSNAASESAPTEKQDQSDIVQIEEAASRSSEEESAAQETDQTISSAAQPATDAAIEDEQKATASPAKPAASNTPEGKTISAGSDLEQVETALERPLSARERRLLKQAQKKSLLSGKDNPEELLKALTEKKNKSIVPGLGTKKSTPAIEDLLRNVPGRKKETNAAIAGSPVPKQEEEQDRDDSFQEDLLHHGNSTKAMIERVLVDGKGSDDETREFIEHLKDSDDPTDKAYVEFYTSQEKLKKIDVLDKLDASLQVDPDEYTFFGDDQADYERFNIGHFRKTAAKFPARLAALKAAVSQVVVSADAMYWDREEDLNQVLADLYQAGYLMKLTGTDTVENKEFSGYIATNMALDGLNSRQFCKAVGITTPKEELVVPPLRELFGNEETGTFEAIHYILQLRMLQMYHSLEAGLQGEYLVTNETCCSGLFVRAGNSSEGVLIVSASYESEGALKEIGHMVLERNPEYSLKALILVVPRMSQGAEMAQWLRQGMKELNVPEDFPILYTAPAQTILAPASMEDHQAFCELLEKLSPEELAVYEPAAEEQLSKEQLLQEFFHPMEDLKNRQDDHEVLCEYDMDPVLKALFAHDLHASSQPEFAQNRSLKLFPIEEPASQTGNLNILHRNEEPTPVMALETASRRFRVVEKIKDCLDALALTDGDLVDSDIERKVRVKTARRFTEEAAPVILYYSLEQVQKRWNEKVTRIENLRLLEEQRASSRQKKQNQSRKGAKSAKAQAQAGKSASAKTSANKEQAAAPSRKSVQADQPKTSTRKGTGGKSASAQKAAAGSEMIRSDQPAPQKAEALPAADMAPVVMERPAKPDPYAPWSRELEGLLEKGHTYTALAYAHARALEEPGYQKVARQLAWAVNDPYVRPTYNSASLFEVFEEPADAPEAFVAAVMRALFYEHTGFDFQLDALYDICQSLAIHRQVPELGQLVHMMYTYAQDYEVHMDQAAEYRQGDSSFWREQLASARARIQEFRNVKITNSIKETVANVRILKTKLLIFSPSGDFAKAFDLVLASDPVEHPVLRRLPVEKIPAWNGRLESFEDLRSFLKDNLIETGQPIAPEHVDMKKAEAMLDGYWNMTIKMIGQTHHSTPVLGGVRTNLTKWIASFGEVLAAWVQALDHQDSGSISRATKALLEMRPQLLATMNTAKQRLRQLDSPYSLLLLKTLDELKARLSGRWHMENASQLYIHFLLSSDVYLDEHLLPVLEPVDDLPELSPVNRILAHAARKLPDWKVRLNHILGMDEDSMDELDDYGTFHQIMDLLKKRHVKLEEDYEKLAEEGFPTAEAYARNQYDDFIGELELAQSYGRISQSDTSIKDTLTLKARKWLHESLESHNFSLFYRILAGYKTIIHNSGSEIGLQLRAYQASLEQEKAKDSSLDRQALKAAFDKVEDALEHDNFSAAEDMLNRIAANDLYEGTLELTSYLDDFQKSYNNLYRRLPGAGMSMASLLNHVVVRNRNMRGHKDLIENWPKSIQTVTRDQISSLLRLLGLGQYEIRQTGRGAAGNYVVYAANSLEAADMRLAACSYPIPAFGTQARNNGLQVVSYFGRADALQIMDLASSLDGSRNTIILLDTALSLPDRQELARKMKDAGSGKTFLVIDRVAILYLAENYQDNLISRMLMSIGLPYSYCQPYEPYSGQPLSPEMFMGRRRELEEITSPTGINLVYGGRQLGKSALLRMAKNEVDKNSNHERAIVVDLNGKNWQESALFLGSRLYAEDILDQDPKTTSWDELAAVITRRLKDTARPIPYLLVLMDEADALIHSSREVNFAPFTALKTIQLDLPGRFKFVCAGLRDVLRFQREMALANNSSLPHLPALTIKPFKAAEAMELLKKPLAYLGFRFEESAEGDRLVSSILNATNYFPGLIQLYCARLIEAMRDNYAGYTESNIPPYVISESHMKNVLTDRSFHDEIKTRFDLTLELGEDNYYKILAMLVAYHAHEHQNQQGITIPEIEEYIHVMEIKRFAALNTRQIEALLEEMRELNVLQRNDQGEYRFSRSSFLPMMGSVEAVNDQLMELIGEQ